MKIHPIKVAFDNMGHGIKNTARDHIEGTYIMIRCLARSAKRTEFEVIEWLVKNNIPLTGINGISKK